MPLKTQRKRRLRKKLFLDEFAVYIFQLKIDLCTASADEELAFLDNLIRKLEGMQLYYLGHFLEDKLRGHIVAKGRYNSPSEAQRQEIIAWCSEQPSIKESWIGEFIDAYYEEPTRLENVLENLGG